MSSDSSDRRSPPSLGGLVAIAVVLVVLAGAAFWLSRPERIRGVDAKRARRLVEAKLKGVAYLENGENEEAAEVFQSLTEQLPEELLPIRNLAIAKLLHFQTTNEDTPVQDAVEALQQLVEFEQRSPESLWLYASLMRHPRVSQPSAQRDQQLQQLLSEAIETDEDNPVYWFGVYEIGNNSTSQEAQANGEAALKKAWELEPNNLWVLGEVLSLQAKKQDPQLEATLQAARNILSPLEASVQRESQISITQHLDDAEQALADGDWASVYRNVFRLRNAVSYSELSKLDHARVAPHPLEFLALDFSANVPQPAASARAETLIEFSLQPQSLPIELDDPSAEIMDVELADFDLNGSVDLIALAANKLIVATQDDGVWTTALQLDVPDGVRGMLLADLDRDRIVLKKRSDGAAEVAKPPSLEEVASQPTVEPQGDRRDSEAATVDGGLEAAKQVPLDVAAEEPAPATACHEADLDLIVYGEFGVLVFRNTSTDGGEVGMELAPQPDALANLLDVRCGVLADVDHDSDVDIVLGAKDGIHVWSLTGPSLVFEETTQWSILPENFVARAMAIVDWDRDADIDIVVGSEAEDAVLLLENQRHGRFAFRELGPGWRGGRDLAVVDCDGNVAWDVLAVSDSGILRLPSATDATGAVRELDPIRIESESATGAIVEDFDNNGAVDLLAWRGGAYFMVRGGLDASFQRGFAGTVAADITCGAAADWDADGDLDVLLGTKAGLAMLTNEGGNQNQWLTLQARGTADNVGRANHTGIGSLVELKSAERYQARVVVGQQTHFGLGRQLQPDVIRIIWPNGVPQGVVSPPSNLTLCEPLKLMGSCPYLYTWNGERFEFHTDCLWAAPIGMQVADGVQAPSRSWEYLKIPGERLAPTQDGRYRMQLTEELWEVAYFDELELLVVDHPEEAEVYSNEKVGPAEIAAFKMHTVARPQRPVAATDQTGRDVLSVLAEKDDNYLRAFQHRLRQGLTEPHYIELDLGPLDAQSAPHQITLFLTGWIYPTDTSLNVGFSHDPDTDAPRFPTVWTPDADGVWRESQPFMGFPGGKTKTIAIDLSNAFANGDYRVRIATTAEIYWDQAFFTVDEPSLELRVQTLPVLSADLHYRGVSALRWHKRNAPERFEYDRVMEDPVWPPLRGAFTRYGDVTELLRASDDRLAVLGAGDEMTVDFMAAAPPPQGWKRDFVLHCVGWDKDANLNTLQGQSVEPLPVQAMKQYGAHLAPDTDAYRDYLQRYQTRRQAHSKFWHWTKDYRR